MTKEKKPLPKREVYQVSSPQEVAIKNNQRNRAISEAYFSQDPTIQNLARGIYYYFLSDPNLGGMNESGVQTGIAPVTGVASKSIQALKYLPAIIGSSYVAGKSLDNSSFNPALILPYVNSGISNLKKRFFADEEDTDAQQQELSIDNTSTPSAPIPEEPNEELEEEKPKENKKPKLPRKNWRERLADRIRGDKPTQTKSDIEYPLLKTVGKTLIELPGFNFGPMYGYRNAGRIALALAFPKTTGYVIGTVGNKLSEFDTRFSEGFEKGRQQAGSQQQFTQKQDSAQADKPSEFTIELNPNEVYDQQYYDSVFNAHRRTK